MKTLLKYLALGVVGVACSDIFSIFMKIIIEDKPLSYETFVPLSIGDTLGFHVFVFIFSFVFFSPFLWLTDKFLKNNRWRYLMGGTIAGGVLGLLFMNGDVNDWRFYVFTALGLIGGVLLTFILNRIEKINNLQKRL